MANVLFTRKDAPTLSASQSIPVTDGQLIFDTSGSGKMYMDVGSSRLEMGGAMTIDDKLNSTSTNPIQNKAVGGVMLSTLDEINTATSKGFITDALATRALAQKIGTTDISAIGDGTCTGAISALNSSNTFESYRISDGVILQKVGRQITITITIEVKNFKTGWNVIGTIPYDYLPYIPIRFSLYNNNVNNLSENHVVDGIIYGGGDICIYAFSESLQLAPSGIVSYPTNR